MPGDLLVAGVVALAVLVAVGALYLARRRALLRRVGSFVCWSRRTADGPWVAGIALYGTGRLDWYRRHSIVPRPARTWSRSALEVVTRDPVPGRGRTVRLVCRHGTEQLELMTSADAAAGLVSWLEAAPPASVSPVL